MSAVPAALAPAPDALGRMRRALARAENGLLVALLASIVLLPLAEAVLRRLLGVGIAGSAALVQHLTLVASMAGAAVAAREDKLLPLFSLSTLLGPRARAAGRFASRTFGAAVCALLCAAGADFVAAERDAGGVIAYGIPVWAAQCVLPAGFALVGLRLAWNSGKNAYSRGTAACLAVLPLASAPLWIQHPDWWTAPALALIAACALAGAPVFAVIAAAALFLFAQRGTPIAALALDHYRLVVNPTLPAIPLFALAGYLFAESAAPRRLIEVFDALFGRLRGGAAIATVLACTFFTSFTGASGVTILALGGLVMPLLLSSGYAARPALGLVTAAGLPGTLLMPALPLILYAIVAGVTIRDMFVGGLLPALLMVGIVSAWGVSLRPRRREEPPPFDWAKAGAALANAKWELGLPLAPVAALVSGLATPVEAAALTALLAFAVTTLLHRDLKIASDVPRVVAECGFIVGGMLLILGVVLGLTDCLVDAQVPDRLIAWVTDTVGSRVAFLLALNAFLLLAGCVMEIYPAILVLAPLVTQIGAGFGVHPVHLGAIFLANMELGYLTPLVGLNLFFASYRFGKPITEIFRAVMPLFLALGAGVLIVTYVPWLSTAPLGFLR
jgi:C4-dicarboxylate transporter DctM subunit